MAKLLILILMACTSGALAKPPRAIKGGDLAAEGEFPWQASLQKFGRHLCGGSIIDKSHILTAAHCVLTRNLHSETGLTILVGTNNKDQRSSNIFRVKRIQAHEKYIGKAPYRYDIAVITLTTPIEFNRLQRVIDLPTRDADVGEEGTISGWGVTDYPSRQSGSPAQLMKMKKKVVSNASCNQQHRSMIHPEHLCAFSRNGQGVCHGDSGSGLVVNGKIVGIASWVRPCGVGYPDVYTRVYSYRAWIAQKIADDP
ncbi:chymotrypsin-1 [Diachasma alloeum]|uniref:chymotrypsin-1 n=1 Tax=Diachasma alloeum TaxID=454923 RepID=UPI0007383AD3|nr:chymotrypsin-1 [Diachasma alloeum]